MKVQETMLSIRMQGWIRQIQECQESGLSVTEWCGKNGINTKTYYNRRKRVREELLESRSPNGSLALNNIQAVCPEPPVFASIPVLKINSDKAAARVQIGTYIAEINNGADLDTIEGVLRTLSRL